MARLEYAMMTVTPVVILFLAQGQEQLYRGPDFGQGQFGAKLVPRLPVLLSPCNLRKSQILGVADSSPCFDASVYGPFLQARNSSAGNARPPEGRTDSKVR